MIPLMLNFSGKKVVIFGGGDVGARKAGFFCPEAEVTVYSRSFSPRFTGMGASLVEKDLSGVSDEALLQLLGGSYLAVAATPDAVLNDRIGTLCRMQGILFNNARGESGDVLIPSVIRGDHFILSISTGGKSPAVSRYLREYLQSSLPGLDRMVELQERLRHYLRETEPGIGRRKAILSGVLHDREVWEALEEGEDTAWSLVERRYL
ncbi:MAG: bifunctional precorrin-2 dehydrogenase/sirohydrochlorin ferrochelatase [Methanomicrobiales archaeon]|nr:bifunctional precorrin-2 dehydrogenase/sirohydrochlorin ferrochelatase [Methanomicrobiales archaeon]